MRIAAVSDGQRDWVGVVDEDAGKIREVMINGARDADPAIFTVTPERPSKNRGLANTIIR